MVKFMILFHRPDDVAAFEARYNAFLAMIERMPGITRRQVSDVWGSPVGESPFFRILEVYFDDRARMDAALKSKAGQAAGAQLQRFPAARVEMLFADVYEEAGGQTGEPGASGG